MHGVYVICEHGFETYVWIWWNIIMSAMWWVDLVSCDVTTCRVSSSSSMGNDWCQNQSYLQNVKEAFKTEEYIHNLRGGLSILQSILHIFTV